MEPRRIWYMSRWTKDLRWNEIGYFGRGAEQQKEEDVRRRQAIATPAPENGGSCDVSGISLGRELTPLFHSLLSANSLVFSFGNEIYFEFGCDLVFHFSLIQVGMS